MYYYGARWYDPGLGRFIQPDTIVPHPGNTGSFDRYAYTLNNPLNRIDPSGHGDCPLNDAGESLGFGENVAPCAAGGNTETSGRFTGGGAPSGQEGYIEIKETGQAFADTAGERGSSVETGGAENVLAVTGNDSAGGQVSTVKGTVYRVIRPDEIPTEGLSAKNPNANYSPEGHILNGSRPGFKSQYISTTADINVANKWAVKTGNEIVEIDLTKVKSNIIDLSTESGRNTYLRGVTARNFAKASSEVLIEGHIPPEAVKLLTE